MRVVTLFLAPILFVGCAAIRSYEIIQQPVATTLEVGLGGRIFRIERTSDLPNAFGGADIWGGKVDRGFVDLQFAGLADDGRLILRLTDVETRSNETAVSRYGVGYVTATGSTSGSWTRASGVYIPPPQGQTVVLPPNTIEFLYDASSGSLVVGGIEVTFAGASLNGVRYRLRDLREPQVAR